MLEALVEINNEMKMDALSSSSCADSILLPLPVALELTSRLFASSSTSSASTTENQDQPVSDLDSLAQRTINIAVEVCKEGDQVELHVDLFRWLVLVVAEYCCEVSSRKSLARLLFETASTGTLTSYCPRPEDQSGDFKAVTNNGGINFPQFEAVMEVLWQGIPRNEIDVLYSLSYEHQQNVGGKYDLVDGITLEAFLHVAGEQRFFLRSRPGHTATHPIAM